MNAADIDLIEQACIHKARKDFYAYRQYMSGFKLKTGWFVRKISREIQQFYDDYKAGKRPILVLEAPPQHGKSIAVTDGVPWMSGDNPELRFIYASFSERLGVRANKSTERTVKSEKYRKIYPSFPEIGKDGLTNDTSLIEYGPVGYFRNTTVRGSVTGESLDIGIIDDPIRGRKDANSVTVRETTWDWFTDDFYSRFDEMGGLIIVLTRWHVDDPVGRLLDSDMANRVRVVSFQAIAERDEEHRKAGEPLFPEHKSLEFLLGRKAVMSAANWSALYQQNPFVQGGEIFKEEYWQYWRTLPKMKRKRIYADTAQKTKEQNDYSVFQCWGEAWNGGLYLIDQLRGKWEAPELLTRAEAFFNKHSTEDCIVSAFKVEDKSSGTDLIQSLRRKKRIPVVPIPRDIDKVSRANDTVPLIESSAVYLPEEAPWLSDYLDEFAAFPNGAHDDQIDPTMDAITDFLGGSERDYEALL